MSFQTIRKAVVYLSLLALPLLIFMAQRGEKQGGIERPLMMFGVGFFGVVLLTSIVKWMAVRFGVLDRPDPRKIHAVPIPLLGGLAVFVAFFGAHLVHMDFTMKTKGLFYGATLILIVGLLDDVLHGLSDKIRLIAQVAATAIVIHYGIVLDFFPHTSWGHIISIILTLVWIVGITNAVNFMDGMDGLCSGMGAVSAGIFFIIAYQTNQPYLGFVSACLCGACAGFLVHNFKPASIFLGDAGSTTIGFILACLGLKGSWSAGNPFISFTVPVLVLGVPIFDMIYTSIERFWSGKVHSVGELLRYAGKDHFHHRLVNHGFNRWQTILFLYFLSITLGLSAVVITRTGSMIHVFLLLLQTVCVFLIITFLMVVYRENNDKAADGSPGPE